MKKKIAISSMQMLIFPIAAQAKNDAIVFNNGATVLTPRERAMGKSGL